MNTTSGGMNPMLRMTLIVIRASTNAAIGMSHIAVLLGPGVTSAAPAPSDAVPETVPSSAISFLLWRWDRSVVRGGAHAIGRNTQPATQGLLSVRWMATSTPHPG